MSLSSLASFSAKKPFTVIILWIFAIVISGVLSNFYLDSALGGNGQGSTKDLEFKLAQMLKDEKMSEIPSSGEEQATEEPSSDNLLVVSSEKYIFPSEEYFTELNNFFNKVQSEIDSAGVNQTVGSVQDLSLIHI